MIKDKTRYRITRAQVERFSEALRELEDKTAEGLGVHPLLLKAQRDALRNQLADLEEELRVSSVDCHCLLRNDFHGVH